MTDFFLCRIIFLRNKIVLFSISSFSHCSHINDYYLEKNKQTNKHDVKFDFDALMPHKNRKYKKRINNQNGVETKIPTPSNQLQAKEIEQVAAILKSNDLVLTPEKNLTG